ncbi:MAG: hypothetical protein HY079_12785 [Elusimicrobia bacterium]|nr:hypothetical protein [Elusimicrobiota bacterium]
MLGWRREEVFQEAAMNRFLTAAAMVVPGAAGACEMGMQGMRHGAGGGCMLSGGGHVSSVLMAATAALGYWVLRQSAKDDGATKRAGQAVGWVLAVVGLGGFLCGSLSHARRMAGGSSGCPMPAAGGGPAGMDGMRMPPGHPPIGGMTAEPPAAPKPDKKGK